MGFLAALALIAILWAFQSANFIGGYSNDSPSGTYSLRIDAPLSPKHGGTYSIELVKKPTKQALRRIAITIPRSEETVTIRGGHASVVWEPAETSADIFLDHEFLIRVAVSNQNSLKKSPIQTD